VKDKSAEYSCRLQKIHWGSGKIKPFISGMCSERSIMTIGAMHHGGTGPSKTDGGGGGGYGTVNSNGQVKDREDGHKRPGEDSPESRGCQDQQRKRSFEVAWHTIPFKK
jgi:hypothetical protein